VVQNRVDFFISRAGADAGTAERIAAIIREAGLVPFYQNEDFGHADFMRRMEEGYASSARMIALLSAEYQQSEFCRAEYNHILAKDPANQNERLIVFRVSAGEPTGNLQNLPYTDLVPVMSDRAALTRVVRIAIKVDQKPIDLQFWQPLKRAGQQIRHPEIRALRSFTGRTDLLDSLDHKLWVGRGAVAIRNSAETTIALRGLGGVGKTVLAQEYAWRNKERYYGIWWIRAGRGDTLADDLIALGKRLIPGLDDLEPQDAAQRTLDHLAQVQTPKPWLMVYDNVDDPVTIRRLTPTDNAHVLITTRRTDWDGEVDELAVDVFDPDNAVEFLMAQARQDDRAAAGRLADALGRLPLALSHARAYCWNRNWCFDQYTAHLPELIDKAPKSATYPASVFATFSLAIENAAHDCPEADALMGLLAFWAPDQVPLWLIPGETGDAIEALNAVSLVRPETQPNGDPAVSVHRLVQEVTRSRLRVAGCFEEMVRRATRATFSAYDDSETFAALERRRYWLPHAMALVLHTPQAGETAWYSHSVWNQIGDVRRSRGESTAALQSYRTAWAIADRLAKSNPDNTAWQRNLSASFEKIGNVQVAHGDLAGALKSYNDGLAITDRLAKSDPSNAGWQRELSVSFNKVGDVQLARDDLAGALKSYNDGLAITDRLAKSDPGNAEWQRDLSVSFEKFGDVRAAQGDLAAALKSYNDSLTIRDRLAKSDPANAIWQRDLAVSNERLGDIYGRQSQTVEAIAAFKGALRAYRALLARNPDDAQSLVFSVEPLWRIGELRGKQGRSDLESALAILKPLAAADRLDAKRRSWIPLIQKQIDELSR
jgi:tetratricopeptide (TPR) repeat protein